MPHDRAVARLIDHTILKPEATRAEVVKVCAEARQYGFASVCVNPCWVPLVARELAGTEVKVCGVVGFPLGAATAGTKTGETIEAIAAGAREIDMVINVGALRAGEDDVVAADIRGVVNAAHLRGVIVKVILETALLNDEQKVRACRIAKAEGADFVKTSTGFSQAGATVADVRLMRETVGPKMGVKASGGVRTIEDLRAMVEAGATRIGASASVAIVDAAVAAGTSSY